MTPVKVQIFKTIFFLSNFTYTFGHFFTCLRPYYQNSFFKKISTPTSRMSSNMCIWPHKLCNAKTGISPTFTLSNEPWFKWLHLKIPATSLLSSVRTSQSKASRALAETPWWGLSPSLPAWKHPSTHIAILVVPSVQSLVSSSAQFIVAPL